MLLLAFVLLLWVVSPCALYLIGVFAKFIRFGFARSHESHRGTL
jgi:hypothetical protein